MPRKSKSKKKAKQHAASNTDPVPCAACGKTGGNHFICKCDTCKETGWCEVKGQMMQTIIPTQYCSVTCQQTHQEEHQKHRTLIESFTKELTLNLKRTVIDHRAALFKQPPPREECPICCLTMPLDKKEIMYQGCCGKNICHGCIHAVHVADFSIPGGSAPCPFCRDEACLNKYDAVPRLKRRISADDSNAMYHLGCGYSVGQWGLEKDMKKAIELWTRAAELGNINSHCILGSVENDEKKAKYHTEIAAMGGDVEARHKLGWMEMRAMLASQNDPRALAANSNDGLVTSE